MKKIVFTFVLLGLSCLSSLAQDCNPTCPKQIEVTHTKGNISAATQTTIYSTVEYDGKCWLTQNLGATMQAATADDGSNEAAGWYWQFNRKQGFAPSAAANGSAVILPAGVTWITSIDEGIVEDQAWKADTDPCTLLLGTGWHIPLNSDWVDADAAGSWGTLANVFDSPLVLHAAGWLSNSAGNLTSRSSNGYCWSSTSSSSTTGGILGFNATNSLTYPSSKASAYAVRCCRNL